MIGSCVVMPLHCAAGIMPRSLIGAIKMVDSIGYFAIVMGDVGNTAVQRSRERNNYELYNQI